MKSYWGSPVRVTRNTPLEPLPSNTGVTMAEIVSMGMSSSMITVPAAGVPRKYAALVKRVSVAVTGP